VTPFTPLSAFAGAASAGIAETISTMGMARPAKAMPATTACVALKPMEELELRFDLGVLRGFATHFA
jgi:hypothetical protein